MCERARNFMAPLIGEGLRSVSMDSIDLPFTLIETVRRRIWEKSLAEMDSGLDRK